MVFNDLFKFADARADHLWAHASAQVKETTLPETAADIWGRCEDCNRWFACPRWFDKQALQPVCPVCMSEPAEIQNRAVLEDSTPIERQPR